MSRAKELIELCEENLPPGYEVKKSGGEFALYYKGIFQKKYPSEQAAKEGAEVSA